MRSGREALEEYTVVARTEDSSKAIISKQGRLSPLETKHHQFTFSAGCCELDTVDTGGARLYLVCSTCPRVLIMTKT